MSDLHDLIRACKVEPDDDAPRLILADWLEEHGELGRAAFLRRQVLAPGVPGEDHSYIRQWAEPWEQLGEEIRSSRSAGSGLYSLEFERGFLRIGDGYQDLYDRLNQILNPPFDWTWVEEIRFGSWHDGDWTPLFQSGRLLELNRHEFIDDGYRSNLLEPLLGSRFVTSLKHLRLMMVSVGDEEVARLSECRNLAGLRSLMLDEMHLGPTAARSLATSELWDDLRSCRAFGSRFGDAGLAEFATGRRRPRLETLDLTFGNYSNQGLVELARSDRFPALRELAVGYSNTRNDGGSINALGVHALLRSPTLARTRIVVNVMSFGPMPAALAHLQANHPARLELRYRNPREVNRFRRWVPCAGEELDLNGSSTAGPDSV